VGGGGLGFFDGMTELTEFLTGLTGLTGLEERRILTGGT
jgi:hypothetical protein